MYAVKVTESSASGLAGLSTFVGCIVLTQNKDQAKALVEEYGFEWADEPPSVNWGIPVVQDASTGEGGGPDGPQG